MARTVGLTFEKAATAPKGDAEPKKPDAEPKPPAATAPKGHAEK